MNRCLSKNMAGLLAHNDIIAQEDQELYAYGLHYALMTLLNIATTILIGLVFGMLWQSMVFMASYIPLRMFAGGYHARTQLRCYVSSVVMIIAALIEISYLVDKPVLALILAGLAIAVIWRLAPIGDANKPLDDEERQVYRRRTRMVLGAEIGLLAISLSIGMHTASACLVCGLVAVAGMLVASKGN